MDEECSNPSVQYGHFKGELPVTARVGDLSISVEGRAMHKDVVGSIEVGSHAAERQIKSLNIVAPQFVESVWEKEGSFTVVPGPSATIPFTKVSNSGTVTATRATVRQAAKDAAIRHRELKGKVVCLQDTVAQRNAKQEVSIVKYFQSSRNASNRQPLHFAFNLVSAASDSTSRSLSKNTVSVDINILETEAVLLSQNGSRSSGRFQSPTVEVAYQLREDMIHISDGEEDIESDDDFQEIPPPLRKPKLIMIEQRGFRVNGQLSLFGQRQFEAMMGRSIL